MSDLAKEAFSLMNNPAMEAALEDARQQLITAALGCHAKDDESRRRYLDAVRTVDSVKAHLQALLSNEGPSEVPFTEFYQERAKSRFKALFTR